jgi:protein ImuA
MHAEKIAALRASLAKPGLEEKSARIPLGHGAVDLCLKGGLERSALHEVFAAAGHEAAATGFVIGLAARVAAGKRMLWVYRDFLAAEFGSLSATGLLELGIDPEHMLLFQAESMEVALRAANDALSCAALGAVVIEVPGNPKILDMVASRRLTLAAAQKSIAVFLLRLNARQETSTAQTRWLVRAAASPKASENWGYPIFMVDLVRNRLGQTGHWVMEWRCDEQCFQTPAQHHGSAESYDMHTSPIES